MIVEYYPKFELYDYVAQSGKFSEDLARYYMRQLTSALVHVYEQGYVKLENLLLDNEFNLKLIDFGFVGKNEGLLQTKCGTKSNMAPELHKGKPYSGEKADMFALGVILFSIVTGHPPFMEARPNDGHYRLFLLKKLDVFW